MDRRLLLQRLLNAARDFQVDPAARQVDATVVGSREWLRSATIRRGREGAEIVLTARVTELRRLPARGRIHGARQQFVSVTVGPYPTHAEAEADRTAAADLLDPAAAAAQRERDRQQREANALAQALHQDVMAWLQRDRHRVAVLLDAGVLRLTGAMRLGDGRLEASVEFVEGDCSRFALRQGEPDLLTRGQASDRARIAEDPPTPHLET